LLLLLLSLSWFEGSSSLVLLGGLLQLVQRCQLLAAAQQLMMVRIQIAGPRVRILVLCTAVTGTVAGALPRARLQQATDDNMYGLQLPPPHWQLTSTLFVWQVAGNIGSNHGL
jgi:hypothetical protein